jgi:hypothetical protein
MGLTDKREREKERERKGGIEEAIDEYELSFEAEISAAYAFCTHPAIVSSQLRAKYA